MTHDSNHRNGNSETGPGFGALASGRRETLPGSADSRRARASAAGGASPLLACVMLLAVRVALAAAGLRRHCQHHGGISSVILQLVALLLVAALCDKHSHQYSWYVW